jgi:hypothetical protein
MKTTNTLTLQLLTALLLLAPAAQAYYSPSAGRWLNRDPLWERGGMNLQAFIQNDGISSADARGLSACAKCGVKRINLRFVGFAFTSESWFFHLIGDVSFKTAYNDGPRYDSACCKVIQYVRARDTVNGMPQATGAGGGPLDGRWHVDVWGWSPSMDDPATPGNTVTATAFRVDPEGEMEWMQDSHDNPGMGRIQPGDTFDDKTAFQWKVYDLCSNPLKPKLVGTSRVVRMHVWTTPSWPAWQYSYTR